MLRKPHTSNTLQNAVHYICSSPQISGMCFFSSSRSGRKQDLSVKEIEEIVNKQ